MPFERVRFLCLRRTLRWLHVSARYLCLVLNAYSIEGTCRVLSLIKDDKPCAMNIPRNRTNTECVLWHLNNLRFSSVYWDTTRISNLFLWFRVIDIVSRYMFWSFDYNQLLININFSLIVAKPRVPDPFSLILACKYKQKINIYLYTYACIQVTYLKYYFLSNTVFHVTLVRHS
jgi:hypothetical protein